MPLSGTTTDRNVGAALRAAIACLDHGTDIAAGDSGSHIQSHFQWRRNFLPPILSLDALHSRIM